MRVSNLVGVLLIIIGIITLSYKSFNYSTTEKVAELGNLKITVEEDKSVDFPPILGGLCIGIGLVLIVSSIIKKS